MRVDALEIAQHVEMERVRLYAFRSTFAQPRQMAVRTGEFRGSDFPLFADERASDLDVFIDEDAEGKLEVVCNALVEGRELRRSFLREKSKSTSGEEVSKAEGGETATGAPSNYSRGEGQKPVTAACKENWNEIFSRRRTRTRRSDNSRWNKQAAFQVIIIGLPRGERLQPARTGGVPGEK